MTPWKQTFESQQCLELVRASLKLLSSASTERLSEDGLGQFTRLLKVLKVLEQRFLSLDPELFPLNTWGNFNSWLNEARNNIEHFAQNQDPGHLENANSYLDHTLAVFRPLDLIFGAEGAKPITDAAESFQRQSHSEVEKLRSRCDELTKTVERLTEAIDRSLSFKGSFLRQNHLGVPSLWLQMRDLARTSDNLPEVSRLNSTRR